MSSRRHVQKSELSMGECVGKEAFEKGAVVSSNQTTGYDLMHDFPSAHQETLSTSQFYTWC
jgi:hypothetical protein